MTKAITEAGSKTAFNWPLTGLALAALMASLDTSIANVALPGLSAAFGASFHAVQWVVLAYLLAVTSLIVGVGRLGDIVGRCRLLMIGVALFTASSLACGLSPTLEVLIATRALQGVGAAVMMALSMALVADVIPKERTGAAMGVLGTVSAIGTTLGPSLGGVLIDAAGWPVIFLINVPVGLVTLWIARRTLPADRRASSVNRPRFDVCGTVVLALTLAAYALATTTEGGAALSSPILFGAASVGVVLFIITQRRAAHPVMPLAALREAGLGAGLIMSGLVATVMMTTLVVGPFYLTGAVGLDAARAGLVISVGPLVAALAGAPAGRLVDRFGAGRVVLWALIGMAGGLAGLAVAPAVFGVAGYIASIVVLTSHYALFQAANNTAIMRGVAADRRGVISGLLSLSRNLGLITGASVMGALFARVVGAANVADATAQAVAAGMQATFIAAAGLMGLALGTALIGRRASARR
jgi:EmrB/QacA subfamily drug resistance transporter